MWSVCRECCIHVAFAIAFVCLLHYIFALSDLHNREKDHSQHVGVRSNRWSSIKTGEKMLNYYRARRSEQFTEAPINFATKWMPLKLAGLILFSHSIFDPLQKKGGKLRKKPSITSVLTLPHKILLPGPPLHVCELSLFDTLYCIAGNFCQEFNFVPFVKAIFWLN